MTVYAVSETPEPGSPPAGGAAPIRGEYDPLQATGVRWGQLDREGQAAVQDILEEVVFSWREVLQTVWPRDTGTTFARWDSFTESGRIVVENPIDYAGFVRAEGRPIGDAWREVADALGLLMQRAVPALVEAVEMARRRGLRDSALDAVLDVFGFERQAQLFRAVGARQRLRLREAFGFSFLRSGQPTGNRDIIAQAGARTRERTRERARR